MLGTIFNWTLGLTILFFFLSFVVVTIDLLFIVMTQATEKVAKTNLISGQVVSLKKEEGDTPFFLYLLAPTMWLFAKALETDSYYATVTTPSGEEKVKLSLDQYESLKEKDSVTLKEIVYERHDRNPLLSLALGVETLKEFKRFTTHSWTGFRLAD